MRYAQAQKIIFVPGKNPKPDPSIHQQLLWRCLLRGVSQADPSISAEMRESPDVFQLVAWNALYYGFAKTIDTDLPWIDALLGKDGPTVDDVNAVRSWRIAIARLIYRAVDYMSFLIPLIPDPAVRNTAQETDRYFRNHAGIARQVRELLKTPLRRMIANGDRILLIAHSLGSVIAYDALWELWHEEGNRGRIELFVTLGSPLGMHYVQRRLVGFRNGSDRRYPGNIDRWCNFACEGDLTALDPELKDDFSGMLVKGLTQSIEDVHHDMYGYFRNDAGLNVHRSYGYLVQPQVGAAIARWWRGG